MSESASEPKQQAARMAAELAESWVRALEAMVGEKAAAQIDWQAVPEPDTAWWEHTLQFPEASPVWIGAGANASESIGRKILEAAGIEEASTQEILNTFLEIVSQAISGFSIAAGRITGRSVSCDGAYRSNARPESETPFGISFQLNEGGPAGMIFAAFSPSLGGATVARPGSAGTAVIETKPIPGSVSAALPQAPESRTLDLLLEVELPVSVSFGRARLPLRDVLKLTSGAIVELNRSVNEPVEVIVNNCVIARGEVVVIEGYYGIRIQHIVSRQERLRSLN